LLGVVLPHRRRALRTSAVIVGVVRHGPVRARDTTLLAASALVGHTGGVGIDAVCAAAAVVVVGAGIAVVVSSHRFSPSGVLGTGKLPRQLDYTELDVVPGVGVQASSNAPWPGDPQHLVERPSERGVVMADIEASERRGQLVAALRELC
jgi:hypothetical protein